ncbi:LCP family protein [Streptomyces xinghaiensis]|uniref:LCP family protein n=1 Tax=Streptomyces xinghaiensis TaxID=1038928 RepID=UPI00343C3193
MTDWPQGRTADGDGYGRGGAMPGPEPTRRMPHMRRGAQPAGPTPPPPPAPPYGRVPAQQSQGYDDPYAGGDGYNTGQVYGGGGGHGGDPYGRPAPDWGRRIKRGLVALVLVALVVSVGTYFWADSKLRREVDLSIVKDRPEAGEGTNYLIVGSDSREGLSAEDQKRLHTGRVEGKRTDSMMILHVGDNGSTMVSLPRDSYVTIPDFTGSESGKDFPASGPAKLNASYSKDGAPLLVRTVEFNTGLKIDHYAEIGFGGFAEIVDAVGGVEMDIPRDLKEKNSGIDLKKGRQTLDGEQALAFVRQRYGLAGGDLDRTKNQQKFLSALASQTASPSTVLNPFKLYPVMGAGLDTLIVDEDMSLFDLASMFWAMKDVTGGGGKQMNMPIAGSAPGGSLRWDMPKVKQLVSELKNDEPVTVSE